MNWIAASLLSALMLGGYELCTKQAVTKNAVVPVLFLSTLIGAAVCVGFMCFNTFVPQTLPTGLVADPLSWKQHAQILLKSSIVAASWVFTYFALKHLPLSIGSPIRATSPLWTLVGAVLILGERPSLLQTVGILITLGSFIGLSLAGAREGVHFHKNKWVLFLILGTLFGAASSLYDRYLFGRLHFRVPTVQVWFSVYLALLFLPLGIGWKRRWWNRNEFTWRWSIVGISVFLLLADYIYFSALTHPDALVSVVMSLRRGSTLVGFTGSILFMGEEHGWRKLPAVLGIVLGMALAVIG